MWKSKIDRHLRVIKATPCSLDEQQRRAQLSTDVTDFLVTQNRDDGIVHHAQTCSRGQHDGCFQSGGQLPRQHIPRVDAQRRQATGNRECLVTQLFRCQ